MNAHPVFDDGSRRFTKTSSHLLAVREAQQHLTTLRLRPGPGRRSLDISIRRRFDPPIASSTFHRNWAVTLTTRRLQRVFPVWQAKDALH